VTTRGVTAKLLILLVVVGGCAEDEAVPPTNRSPSGPADTSPSSDDAEVSGRCDFPPFRPAYLPWLKAEQPLPAPSRERHAGYAQLAWHGRDSSYVLLWRVSELLGGRGQPAPSLPNGAEGYLYESESDEDIADWAILWADAHDDGCNQTALLLYDPRLAKQEGKQEILRLAATLTEER
jgi:hypothetical protein